MPGTSPCKVLLQISKSSKSFSSKQPVSISPGALFYDALIDFWSSSAAKSPISIGRVLKTLSFG